MPGPSGILLQRKQENIAWGLLRETKLHPSINRYYGEPMTQVGSTNPFSRTDYHNADRSKRGELKSRKCGSYTYETTFIGWDKVEDALAHPECQYTFFFYFDKDNKLFSIPFDWERFRGLEREMVDRSQFGCADHDCCHIPMDWLTPVEVVVLDS